MLSIQRESIYAEGRAQKIAQQALRRDALVWRVNKEAERDYFLDKIPTPYNNSLWWDHTTTNGRMGTYPYDLLGLLVLDLTLLILNVELLTNYILGT